MRLSLTKKYILLLPDFRRQLFSPDFHGHFPADHESGHSVKKLSAFYQEGIYMSDQYVGNYLNSRITSRNFPPSALT